MDSPWLEIPDEQIDAQEIQRRIQERISRRAGAVSSMGHQDVTPVTDLPDSAPAIEESACDAVSRWLPESDIVPAHYVIDWRVPIVGRVHAMIRRVIHAEILRFVLPALVKQSHLNRAILQTLTELCHENERLRQELAELRPDKERER